LRQYLEFMRLQPDLPDGGKQRRAVGRDRTGERPVGPEVARVAAHAGSADRQRTLGLGEEQDLSELSRWKA